MLIKTPFGDIEVPELLVAALVPPVITGYRVAAREERELRKINKLLRVGPEAPPTPYEPEHISPEFTILCEALMLMYAPGWAIGEVPKWKEWRARIHQIDDWIVGPNGQTVRVTLAVPFFGELAVEVTPPELLPVIPPFFPLSEKQKEVRQREITRKQEIALRRGLRLPFRKKR